MAGWIGLIAASIPAGVAWAALLGLGLHRHAGPLAVSASAVAMLFGPPLAVGLARMEGRLVALALALAAWSLCLLIVMPVYFPGERRAAVASGLALITGEGSLARALADGLPDEPEVAEPEVPVAVARVEPPLPPAIDREPDAIALPFEGEGRRLSVPVVFEHGSREVEVYMMLDTGATYTTLPAEVLARLGIYPSPSDPVVELHTANGVRKASMVLLDRVWLGDQHLEGVAVATCEQCAFSDTVGLLGLNVAGGFNMTIDADRREVVFARREVHDRKLDVQQFVDVSARVRPFPGGRVEVEVRVDNHADRPVDIVMTEVRCGEQAWIVEFDPLPAHGEATARRRLPAHEPCGQYGIGLLSASW